MFTVAVDTSGLRAEHKRISVGIARALRTSVNAALTAGVTEAKAVGRFKDRTGELRGTIQGRITQADDINAAGTLRAPAKHATFIEGGTRPHIIRARRAPNLVFWWEREGFLFVGKSVRHPGTPSLPFMGPGYLAAERRLRAEAERALAALGSAS